MLDNVILGAYLLKLETDAKRRNQIGWRLQDKGQAANVATTILREFREDLRASLPEILCLQTALGKAKPRAYTLSPVRILELLVWMETKPKGYYRRECD